MRVAYVVDEFPCLTETFVWREIREIRRLGAEVHVFALRRRNARIDDPEIDAFTESHVSWLPRAWDPAMHMKAMRMPTAWAGRHLRMIWAAARRHRPAPARGIRNLFHISQGLALEEAIKAMGMNRVHAHFASLPSTLAWAACAGAGVPFSFSAHARDLYVESFLLEAKVEAAERVFVCHSHAESWLKARLPAALRDRVVLMRHGLDMEELAGFGAPGAKARKRRTFRALAVGRLVEKKGFEYLVAAAGIFSKAGTAIEMEIIGEGPLRGILEAMIRECGAGGVCSMAGPMPPASVLSRMRESDVLVCPSVVARDGDMDGTPNVVLEAQALGLPVIATQAGGLPDAVEHGRTGIVIPQRDAAAIAEAILALRDDSELRDRLAAGARSLLSERFDVRRNIAPLASLLGLQYPAAGCRG